MAFVMSKVYNGLLYKPESHQIHPIAGLIVLLMQFILVLSNNSIFLLGIFIFILSENYFYKSLRGALNLLNAILVLLIFLGVITYIFAGLEQAIIIILRLSTSAISFSLFFTITNPSDLARALEKLHFSPKISMLAALSLMMVPRVAKDAEETFEALTLRGEVDGIFIRWLPKVIAVFVASVIYRSNFLAQSLYYRGFALGKRTHYKKLSFGILDLVRVVIWILVCIYYLFEISNLF